MMTDMKRGLLVIMPELVKRFGRETLFGRIGYPEELKGGILFLCSDAGRWYIG